MFIEYVSDTIQGTRNILVGKVYEVHFSQSLSFIGGEKQYGNK